MNRCAFVCFVCITLLGCSKDGQAEAESPAACSDYLDCLSLNDPDLFDAEVGVYGVGGSCLEAGDAQTCGQACETRLQAYSGAPECGGDPTEPAPGVFGGLCLAPDGTCNFGQCNRAANYCFDPDDPCRGFFCGGEERGSCEPIGGQPSCTCSAGFESETFALYCCPTDGSDPACS